MYGCNQVTYGMGQKMILGNINVKKKKYENMIYCNMIKEFNDYLSTFNHKNYPVLAQEVLNKMQEYIDSCETTTSYEKYEKQELRSHFRYYGNL